MTTWRSRLDGGNRALLHAAGAFMVFASFLAFIVFSLGSWVLFLVSLLMVVGLVALGLFVSRIAVYLLVAWSLIGAVSQVLPGPMPGRLSIFAVDLVAAVLALTYLRGGRRNTREEF